MSFHSLETPHNYSAQLADKVQQTLAEFNMFGIQTLDVFESPPQHYRMRAEFRVWRSDQGLDYAMFIGQPKPKLEPIKTYPAGSSGIQQLMPRLKNYLNAHPEMTHKLYQIDFLTNQQGDAVVTLIYHKPIDENWVQSATQLSNTLNIALVGRAHKQRQVIGQDYVIEQFDVQGRTYRYHHVEGTFTQPNAKVCAHMLNWATQQAQTYCQGDLLELYCGNGNFTLPLSHHFNKVLATEITKVSLLNVATNCELNNINNIQFVRMSSQDICDALNKKRDYYRLKDICLDNFNFNTLFVDPPRSGLDEPTSQWASQFDTILYISCNPETLKNNLISLTKTHKIQAMALFDQFPFTAHRECGVILTRR